MSHTWDKDIGDVKSGTFGFVSVTVGRIKKSGKGFLQLKYGSMVDNKPVVNFRGLVAYTIP